MCHEVDVQDNKLKARMDPSPYKEIELFARELEDGLMKFTGNNKGYKVDTLSVDQPLQAEQKGDEEVVNIEECSRSAKFGGSEMVEVECVDLDLTGSSSSFSGYDLGVENGDALGESEVSSVFRGDPGVALDSNVCEDMFRMRKKRLTDHWTTYIQPLAWRCRWVELQIKKLEEQALIYDEQLEKCRRQKQVHIEKPTLEVNGIKSLPLSQYYGKNEVLQRKKRRRDEATNDVSSYMANHNLFSYYENKNNTFPKPPIMGSAPAPRNSVNKTERKINIDEQYVEQTLFRKGGDDETALEELYHKLTKLQSRVGELKSRANNVMNEHARQFLTENPVVPSALHHASIMPSPDTAPHPNDAPDRMPPGSHAAPPPTSWHNMENLSMLESAAVGEGAVIPSANRSTYGHNNVLAYCRKRKQKMNTGEQGNIETPAASESVPPTRARLPPRPPAGSNNISRRRIGKRSTRRRWD